MKNNLIQQGQGDIFELEEELKQISERLKSALNCEGEIDLPYLGENLLRK